MTKLSLAIFEDQRILQIETASNKIVNSLSNNYETIFDNVSSWTDKTRSTYKRNIKHFLAFIQTNGINGRTCDSFRKALAEIEGIGNKSRNNYLAAMRALLRESLKYGIMPVDISENVKSFDTESGHTKDGIEKTEISQIHNYINSIEKPEKRERLKVLFQLLACEGFRQMEAIQIRIEEINWKDCKVRFKGKGKSEKNNVEVFRGTIEVLRNYVDFIGRSEGYLFPSKSKKDQPITTRTIRKMFTDQKNGLFIKSGINPERSVHGFRHFFTTHTLEQVKGDLHKAAMRTRHKSTATLKIYDDRRINRKEMDSMEQAFKF